MDRLLVELCSACERNGLVSDGDDVAGAIERGLDAGFEHPHENLVDRRTRAARYPRDGSRLWKNLLRIEVYRLLYVRPETRDHASVDAAQDIIAAIEHEGHVIENLDRCQIGELLGVTANQWKAIREAFGSLPRTFLPYDATHDEIDAYKATVREAGKPRKAVYSKEWRARRKRSQPPTNDRVAKQCKAIVAYAQRYPGRHTTGDLVSGLKRWDAFKDIGTKRLRNVINELLRLATAGKLPDLIDFLIIAKEPARNRKLTFAVEARKHPASPTTHCPKSA
jgi:hypothetical protein